VLYNDFFAKGLAGGFSLPPANYISAQGKTVLPSDAMGYDREYSVCNIREIGII